MERFFKRIEQIECHGFGTEQIRCRVLVRQQIRYFSDFSSLREQVDHRVISLVLRLLLKYKIISPTVEELKS